MVDASKFAADRLVYFKASEIRELLKLTEGREIISLAGGLPDPRVFKKEMLAEIAREVIIEQGERALQYSPTLGVTSFRKELMEFERRHGLAIRDTDDVIITVGSEESLYIITRALINPGDIVIVEEPTYLAAINVFRQYEAQMIGVPIDEYGMRTDILEEKLKQLKAEDKLPKLLYSVPTAQNPSGVTMSNDRRKHLVELASEYDFLIVEDDPYSFFLFEDVDFTFIKNYDKEGRVLYVSTLSKILSPGLRIGWTIGDKNLINLFELTKQAIDLHTPTLTQYIAERALQKGVVDITANEARNLYKIKRDVMLATLEEELSDYATWIKPIGGMFTMVVLKDETIDTKELLLKALDEGVAYVPGKSFYVSNKGKNTMRLNFSYPTPEQIEKGIRILSKVIRAHVKALAR
ncbi:MAG: PLP-dependent aminotransferase family protein [Desulfurococcales archaeon]|nr:PLP-dependent aminotransferase family protein [Desulfurococcales archaeon]